MRNKNILTMLSVLVLAAMLAGCGLGADAQNALTGEEFGSVSRITLSETVEASGSLQAGQFATLMWKTSGTVAQVNVQVGDQVKSGDVLLSLDPTSVPANVISARSELLSAQRLLDDLLASRLPQAQALQSLEQAQLAFDQRELSWQTQAVQAQLALIRAQDAYEDADYNRSKLNYARYTQATLDAAEADYLLAELNVEQAQANYNRVEGRPDDDPMKAQALAALSAAKENSKRALARLNWLKGEPSDTEIQEADATLKQAELKLQDAQSAWERVKDGLSPADVALLEARLADARRAYDLIKDGPNAAEVAQLEARIEAAQATLNQLSITAPFDGEILVLQAAAGDVISAGQAALVVANRQALYVEVQVDEGEIERVKPGAPAQASMEAMPGVILQGEVTFVNPVGQSIGGLVRYTVRVDFDEAPVDALLGTTTDVTIQTGEPAEVLVVPVDAVQNDEQGEYVLKVVGEGAPLRVAVHSGMLVSDQVVVSGELEDGDTLLLTLPEEETGPGGMFMGR